MGEPELQAIRESRKPERVFLLSPAYAGGERARLLLREEASFELAVRLRLTGAPLGEIFAFTSGLYFRGKLAYCKAFAAAPSEMPAALVVTPGYGLVPPEEVITLAQLREIAAIPIDAAEPRYRAPLERDCSTLKEAAGPQCEFVLLGSVASRKYIDPLFGVFGDRLFFPAEFVGRGDMSRGALMLRCAQSGVELSYLPTGSETRHGQRPPKLPRYTSK